MHGPALAHWLRLLWARIPAVRVAPGDAAPFIAQGHIHLPRAVHWHAQRAAAAHAAAHLVYSPRAFDVDGLVPIARTVLAVLEDARVEALAVRELPGLARLWRPLHAATPDSGEGFEALLQRLARALIDPAYPDPHAWVCKGRRMFWLDQSLGLPALRTPAELRAAALALGHDIGQARLPFNARGYRAAPGYRDDHRWMWPADQQLKAAPPPPEPDPRSDASAPPPAPAPQDEALAVTVTRYPEWDRLIQQIRQDWVTVQDQREAQPASYGVVQRPVRGVDAEEQDALPLARRLLRPLSRLTHPAGTRGLARDGEWIDLDALVAWQMARRVRRPGDDRVYRARVRAGARPAAWLLVDQSASSADASAAGSATGAHGPRLFDVASRAAVATLYALQRLQVACAVSGFSSQGRHAVHLRTLKDLHQPQAAGLAARLRALPCGGSTRLGAALRHGVAQVRRWREGPRWVLLLSDAQAHDIDVHDPQYLGADALQAVRSAGRRGVRIACLQLTPGPGVAASALAADARRIFGARGVQPLASLQALPRSLQRLLA